MLDAAQRHGSDSQGSSIPQLCTGFSPIVMVSAMWAIVPRIIKKRQIAGAVIHGAYVRI
jgi:hypothetical protein